MFHCLFFKVLPALEVPSSPLWEENGDRPEAEISNFNAFVTHDINVPPKCGVPCPLAFLVQQIYVLTNPFEPLSISHHDLDKVQHVNRSRRHNIHPRYNTLKIFISFVFYFVSCFVFYFV